MARINKKQAIQRQQGLPSKEQILTAPENTDTVPAQINNANGEPQAPAALTEGEFVISIPAIIAIGEGNYDNGLATLEQMHEELRLQGEELLGTPEQGGLAGAGEMLSQ